MRNIRRSLATAAVAASAVTALVSAGAPAANASAAGYSTVIGCTSAAGSTSFTPGLKVNTPRTTSAALSATLAGCSDFVGNQLPGNGSLFATLSGTSSYGNVAEAGSFVISWPSTYNPSTGTLSLRGPAADGTYTVSGTVTGGAWVGSQVSTKLFVTGTNPGATGRKGHLLTSQSFVNTLPLTLARNTG